MESLLNRKETPPVNPLVFPLAILALSGVFTHTVQLESATHLASAKNLDEGYSHIVERIVKPTQDAQVELSSFTVDTNYMRTQQPPATRNREDDERDYANSTTDEDAGGSSRNLKDLPN
ncbi:MAG: hypothetical protein ACM3KH_00075 [Thiobacillus sp.]